MICSLYSGTQGDKCDVASTLTVTQKGDGAVVPLPSSFCPEDTPVTSAQLSITVAGAGMRTVTLVNT